MSKILIHDLNEIYSYLHFLPFADNEQFPGKFFFHHLSIFTMPAANVITLLYTCKLHMGQTGWSGCPWQALTGVRPIAYPKIIVSIGPIGLSISL